MNSDGTSTVEVTHISGYGIWLLMGDRERFLSSEDFPWFRDVPVSQIVSVEEPTPGHYPASVNRESGILTLPAVTPCGYLENILLSVSFWRKNHGQLSNA